MDPNKDENNLQIAVMVVLVCLLLGFAAASLWALWEPR